MSNDYMTDSQGRQVPAEEWISQAAERCRRQLRKPDKSVMDIKEARRILDAFSKDGRAYALKAGGHKPE